MNEDINNLFNSDFEVKYDADADSCLVYTGNQRQRIDLNPDETNEEKVIRLIKGGFEEQHGISFEEFQKVYKEILENNPEKLI